MFAPPLPTRRATSGISAINAAACTKKEAVTTSASFMRRDSRTYCQPRRIAPRKRSPGSTDGGFASRFHLSSTKPEPSDMKKLSANTYGLPNDAMIAPATSGPTTRERFTATPFNASAAGRCVRETSSGTSAEKTGQRIAKPMPLVKTSSSSTLDVSPPATDTRYSTAALAASQSCVNMR